MGVFDFLRQGKKDGKSSTAGGHMFSSSMPAFSRGRLVTQTLFRKKVKLGALIRITPGKHHAWYESNVGPVRKEIQRA